MRGYFPSILALAQSLLRSPDPCVVPFGGHMYRLSFTAFDSYCQQVRVCRNDVFMHVCWLKYASLVLISIVKRFQFLFSV